MALSGTAKHVCSITGLPAKYRHSKTLQPYATVEAFKQLHEAYLRDEQTKVDARLEQLNGTLRSSLLCVLRFCVLMWQSCLSRRRNDGKSSMQGAHHTAVNDSEILNTTQLQYHCFFSCSLCAHCVVRCQHLLRIHSASASQCRAAKIVE